jgi:hypothetical protein
MGKWGSEGFTTKHPQPLKDANSAVKVLSPKAKQAIYAAAQKGDFAKASWNGCVFNAASIEAGTESKTTGFVARLLEMKQQDVSRFISWWDGSSCTTQELQDAVLQVGLFSEPNSITKHKLTKRVFTSKEQEMLDEFDSLVDGLNLNNPLDETRTDEEVEVATNANLMQDLLQPA